jgi:hypothetical protein
LGCSNHVETLHIALQQPPKTDLDRKILVRPNSTGEPGGFTASSATLPGRSS